MSETEGLLAEATVESDDNQQQEETTIPHQQADTEPSIDDLTIAAEDEEIDFDRPDWYPEKFWNEDGPDIENLAKSYGELQKKFSQGKHKAPDEYDTSIFNEASVEPTDELLETYVAWSKQHNISQSAFEELGKQFIEMAGEIEDDERIFVEEELKKLGPNADATIKSMTDWANGLVRKGVWGEDDFEEFKIMGGTAQGMKALQKIRSYYGDQTVPVNVGVPEGAPSKDELNSMVADPRYQTDPAFRAKVEAAFVNVYGNGEPSN
ncbi:MAG: hypothetical protein VXX02_04225 [Pseudomonadota bacterium]|nr:hypothetical protein [Pseudomonadota bacterium]MEC7561107.1 hypothetical protein [Pseudomonadota bacterium]MEC7955812.1 hypothetical protein [Pseudomonadota bacterium]MEC7970670.1 hypothetical protein [Pseudomonadota bacterium]MEC7991347.1 hypothetical protein [Pseudomonadota bacterium]